MVAEWAFDHQRLGAAKLRRAKPSGVARLRKVLQQFDPGIEGFEKTLRDLGSGVIQIPAILIGEIGLGTPGKGDTEAHLRARAFFRTRPSVAWL